MGDSTREDNDSIQHVCHVCVIDSHQMTRTHAVSLRRTHTHAYTQRPCVISRMEGSHPSIHPSLSSSLSLSWCAAGVGSWCSLHSHRLPYLQRDRYSCVHFITHLIHCEMSSTRGLVHEWRSHDESPPPRDLTTALCTTHTRTQRQPPHTCRMYAEGKAPKHTEIDVPVICLP